MASIVASLDGGGTKTAIIWADSSGKTGQHRINSGCNPQDRADWLDPIRAALRALPARPAHITYGIPGYGEIPQLDAQITATLIALGPPCTLLNDGALAYQGAFPEGGGVLVLAGTGSVAMAREPGGLHRTGGWGDLFGDEGSAHAIGRSALALASQMVDGRAPDTGFAAALTARLGLTRADGPFALMGWTVAQPHPRAAIAGIAAHIDAMAQAGGPAACDLLEAAAGELHLLARTAASRAGLTEPLIWSPAGSVFKSQTLCAELAVLIGSNSHPPAHSALIGGLIASARAAGWPAGAPWRATLKEHP